MTSYGDLVLAWRTLIQTSKPLHSERNLLLYSVGLYSDIVTLEETG